MSVGGDHIRKALCVNEAFTLETPREGAGWSMSNLLSTRPRCALSRCTLHGTVIGGPAGDSPKLCRTSVTTHSSIGPVVVGGSIQPRRINERPADHAIPVSNGKVQPTFDSILVVSTRRTCYLLFQGWSCAKLAKLSQVEDVQVHVMFQFGQ